jgi:hypothetical protein
VLFTVEAVDIRDVLQKAAAEGANLQGAYLRGAYLRGAYLEGAKINWQSHDVISKLLFDAAGDDVEKRKVAGLILISRDWCWKQFLNINAPELQAWALDVLLPYAKDDANAPTVLQRLAATKEA